MGSVSIPLGSLDHPQKASDVVGRVSSAPQHFSNKSAFTNTKDCDILLEREFCAYPPA